MQASIVVSCSAGHSEEVKYHGGKPPYAALAVAFTSAGAAVGRCPLESFSRKGFACLAPVTLRVKEFMDVEWPTPETHGLARAGR